MAFLTKFRSLAVLAAGLAVGTAILATRRTGDRPADGAAIAGRRG